MQENLRLNSVYRRHEREALDARLEELETQVRGLRREVERTASSTSRGYTVFFMGAVLAVVIFGMGAYYELNTISQSLAELSTQLQLPPGCEQ